MNNLPVCAFCGKPVVVVQSGSQFKCENLGSGHSRVFYHLDCHKQVFLHKHKRLFSGNGELGNWGK